MLQVFKLFLKSCDSKIRIFGFKIIEQNLTSLQEKDIIDMFNICIQSFQLDEDLQVKYAALKSAINVANQNPKIKIGCRDEIPFLLADEIAFQIIRIYLIQGRSNSRELLQQLSEINGISETVKLMMLDRRGKGKISLSFQDFSLEELPIKTMQIHILGGLEVLENDDNFRNRIQILEILVKLIFENDGFAKQGMGWLLRSLQVPDGANYDKGHLISLNFFCNQLKSFSDEQLKFAIRSSLKSQNLGVRKVILNIMKQKGWKPNVQDLFSLRDLVIYHPYQLEDVYKLLIQMGKQCKDPIQISKQMCEKQPSVVHTICQSLICMHIADTHFSTLPEEVRKTVPLIRNWMPQLSSNQQKDVLVKRSFEESIENKQPFKRRKNSVSNFSTLFSKQIIIDSQEIFGELNNEFCQAGQVDVQLIRQWDEILNQVWYAQHVQNVDNVDVQHVYSNTVYYRILLRIILCFEQGEFFVNIGKNKQNSHTFNLQLFPDINSQNNDKNRQDFYNIRHLREILKTVIMNKNDQNQLIDEILGKILKEDLAYGQILEFLAQKQVIDSQQRQQLADSNSFSQLVCVCWPSYNENLRTSYAKVVWYECEVIENPFIGTIWQFRINGLIMYVQNSDQIYLRICMENRQPLQLKMKDNLLTKFCIGCYILDGEICVPCLDLKNQGEIQIVMKQQDLQIILWQNTFQCVTQAKEDEE
eukprot:TRINITY_DN11997_c0_g3_i1.p1 TRINITY_DN11997_c0_g3~~TRINITY_DN11997_c0_g3_i1.p1  ORF type:complete len:701 (-),score=43.30 TRINITY_DN11997_c0_g3_i1:244-2346(-)